MANKEVLFVDLLSRESLFFCEDLTHPASDCLVPRQSEPPPGKSQEGNVLVNSKGNLFCLSYKASLSLQIFQYYQDSL